MLSRLQAHPTVPLRLWDSNLCDCRQKVLDINNTLYHYLEFFEYSMLPALYGFDVFLLFQNLTQGFLQLPRG